ncbi:MarR family winged helix-turn-helix transcriptional regulator [Falsirhodobacter deserti]|uniref:MarR family winged helix-turn-helix transcriptional regulator n=1 Tax=Falsirhodobacter deserti TaxID=1365611 RepID=UPI001F4D9C46|nr:MarR family transcriptional regulator [Falsirhodobacter deserti]
MAHTHAPTELLCFTVHAADQAFAQVYRHALSEMGVTYPQFLVLGLLWQCDDRTVGELGQMLRLQSNTLTPLLKRLEAMGLLSRRRDPQDERTVRIRLTDAGRALADKAPDVMSCVSRAIGMTAEEQDTLTTLLRRLQDSLRASTTPAA